MADIQNNGQQEGFALDFLNAQGPASGDSNDSSSGSPSDYTLNYTQDGSGLDGNDTEDPVTRGQSPITKLEQFVPFKTVIPKRTLKQGGTPSGSIPNLTKGARRIP